MNLLAAIIGLAIGAAIGVAFHLVRARGWREEKGLMGARLADAQEALTRQREEMGSLETTFRGLSSEALRESREEFIKQAEPKIAEHVRPLKDALARYEEAVRTIEGRREEAYGGLKEILSYLRDGQVRLTKETGSLVAALKSHSARGRWGEVTLKRIVEVAGMSSHCDFEEQATVGEEDARQRPDLVVRMPGNRSVVVDAKAPLDAYMRAIEASDETVRAAELAAHAQAVRDHMKRLGQKAYWSQFENAPDFVVLFLPGESFFSAALEKDRELIEDGMRSRVILATPTTLIALLRVVAMVWQQEKLAENSQRISDAGRDLYERCQTFADHFSKIGSSLMRAVEFFNKAVGSWEARVIPGARKLKELGATSTPDAELPEVAQIERAAKSLEAADAE